MDSFSGSVERVTYYNSDTGYSVVRIRPRHGKSPGRIKDGLVTIVGNLPELSPGESLLLNGNWVTHPKHGLQFQVTTCEQEMPGSVAGIQRYLGSGLIKGIGPKWAQILVWSGVGSVQHFLHVLDVQSRHDDDRQAAKRIGERASVQQAASQLAMKLKATTEEHKITWRRPTVRELAEAAEEAAELRPRVAVAEAQGGDRFRQSVGARRRTER